MTNRAVSASTELRRSRAKDRSWFQPKTVRSSRVEKPVSSTSSAPTVSSASETRTEPVSTAATDARPQLRADRELQEPRADPGLDARQGLAARGRVLRASPQSVLASDGRAAARRS